MAALMLDLTITRDQIARQEMFKDLFINTPARKVEPFLCVTNFRFVAIICSSCIFLFEIQSLRNKIE